MALSRTSIAASRLHFQNKGTATPNCWLCTATTTGKKRQTKKTEEAKEQRTLAIKTFVKKYMMLNPGTFPKATLVHQEVGGSWYILKNILSDLKENLVSHFENHKTTASAEVDGGTGQAKVTISRCSETNANSNDSKSSELVPEAQQATEIDGGTSQAKTTISRCSETNANSNDSKSSELVPEAQQATEVANTPNESLSSNEDLTHDTPLSPNGNLSCGPRTHGVVREKMRLEVPLPSIVSPPGLVKEKTRPEVPLPSIVSSPYIADGEPIPIAEEAAEVPEIPHDVLSNELAKKICLENEKSEIVLSEESSPGISDEDITANLSTSRGNASSSSGRIRGNASGSSDRIWIMLDRIKELAKDLNNNGHNNSKQVKPGPKFGKPIKQSMIDGLRLFDVIKEQEKIRDSGINNGAKQLQPDKSFVKDDIKDDGPLKVPFEKFDSDEDLSDSEVAASEYGEPDPFVPLPSKRSFPSFSKRPIGQNTLFVKFLPKSATDVDIRKAFGGCGEIEELCIIPSLKATARFNNAYVSFLRGEGLQRALEKSNLVINGADVVVEADSPLLKITNMVSISNLIGDPDAPLPLLENPVRTIMVRGLPVGIGSHQLSFSLSNFGSISRFIMGSSLSIGYIEFETEDAKEKALAASTISLSGKQIQILRIDAPRTSVVRISNIGRETKQIKILSTCETYGAVNRVVSRDGDTVDVHFMLSELGNMLQILNHLNGMVVNQCQWWARPATVFPPQILQSLWKSTEGRQYVLTVVQNLCRKTCPGSTVHAEMAGLVARYYTTP
ncbi:uncharacterized protein LOC18447178 isoform X1 [Amborella trichopoda]|uniref:uncharacterized protein LOC18447178 isoform X1 n=1 Tax=Amborella trichopoda TaxID=13333 RepID=UPI0009BF5634|nr:uncharacterized protein LOC18447178 isoform X1 [Amborella trichopoda]|eukprot:XP_011628120.2 uncharacterized protein LOC18447178 isoform X1 [Amborella trichopoda]